MCLLALGAGSAELTEVNATMTYVKTSDRERLNTFS